MFKFVLSANYKPVVLFHVFHVKVLRQWAWPSDHERVASKLTTLNASRLDSGGPGLSARRCPTDQAGPRLERRISSAGISWSEGAASEALSAKEDLRISRVRHEPLRTVGGLRVEAYRSPFVTARGPCAVPRPRRETSAQTAGNTPLPMKAPTLTSTLHAPSQSSSVDLDIQFTSLPRRPLA